MPPYVSVLLPWLAAAVASTLALLLARARWRDRQRDAAERDELARCREALREARQLLHEEQARRTERLSTLGRMLAGAAHELNNPLAAVRGAAQLLARTPQTEENRAALRILDRETARASAIVKELLSAGRRQERGERQLVDLNEVARYAADARALALGESGIRLELRLADAPVRVLGDRAQLEQAVANLLVNAEQALALARTAAPTIEVQARREDERGVLEVADNGPGVAPAHVPHIWLPFWTTKPADVGTGLGLFVVHGIVLAHDGEVRVESTPGGGARFRVALPAADAAPLAAVLDVLLVDDEHERAAALADALRARGHAVLLAHELAGARRLAVAGRFDVVVVDEGLAAQDALLAELRRLPGCEAARWVVVTGDAAPPAPDVVALRKPYDSSTLWRAVEGDWDAE